MSDPVSPASDDLREYMFAAPDDEIALDSLELRHPSFVAEDGVTPAAVRVINDNDDFEGTLEEDAPMDGGGAVTFKAARFDIVLPESNSPGLPSLTITVDNIGRELMEPIDNATTVPQPVQGTYRSWLASDPSAPAAIVDGFTIRKVTATPTRITAQAGYEDDLNTPFGRAKYTRERFPGLVR